jgi:hypothetical protein
MRCVRRHLVLYEAMDVVVALVVPHALRVELHRKRMVGRRVVVHAGGAASVPAAAHVAAYEAHPQRMRRAAHLPQAARELRVRAVDVGVRAVRAVRVGEGGEGG